MELIHIYCVTVWNSVPAFMQMLAEYALEVKETAENLRVVLLSGDWIPLDLTAKIRRLSQQADIYLSLIHIYAGGRPNYEKADGRKHCQCSVAYTHLNNCILSRL